MGKKPFQIYFGILAVALLFVGGIAFGEGRTTAGWIGMVMAAFFAWGYFDDNFTKK